MDPETFGKTAEATKAVAETGGKAIDAVVSFARIIAGPVNELVAIVEDRIKFARWEGQLALADKAEAIMKRRGLVQPTRELPLNFAVPLLTKAMLEEDDELQETWARLLVNAGDAATEMELRVAYVEILTGMSAFDVKNLSELAKASLAAPDKGYLPVIEAWNLPGSAMYHDEGSRETGKVSEELGISLGNLMRLGCVIPAMGFGGIPVMGLMTVTHLGRALYRACS
ncbi:MAG: Abi-alpha family protein [Bryobacteraceae bacterium]